MAVDVDPRKIPAIEAGDSYIEDVPSELLREVSEGIHASTRYVRLAKAAGHGRTLPPVNPFSLSWRARESDMSTEFIELAGQRFAAARAGLQPLLWGLAKRAAHRRPLLTLLRIRWSMIR